MLCILLGVRVSLFPSYLRAPFHRIYLYLLLHVGIPHRMPLNVSLRPRRHPARPPAHFLDNVLAVLLYSDLLQAPPHCLRGPHPRRNPHTTISPESRLPSAVASAWLVSVGMFWFAGAARCSCIGTCSPYQACRRCGDDASVTQPRKIPDRPGHRTLGSALVANLMHRNLCGIMLAMNGTSMYDTLGNQGVNSGLAGMVCAASQRVRCWRRREGDPEVVGVSE
jgi:hypothetical protein